MLVKKWFQHIEEEQINQQGSQYHTCDTTKHISLHIGQTCILQYSKYEYAFTSFQVIKIATVADLQTNY